MDKILLDALTLPPDEAIRYFEKKGYRITFNWRDLKSQAHARAFTVAGVAKVDILRDIKGALSDSLRKGTPLGTFRKNLEPTLRAKGWWGNRTTETPDGPKTEFMGSPWRLRTIFQTNMQAAYMVGRYQGMIRNTDNRPFWKYVAVLDDQTRDAHRALHGKVFRADDPFWDSFYPPNGFNCRCRVVALSNHEIDRDQVKVTDSADTLKGGLFHTTDPDSGMPIAVDPSPGWDYNPGKAPYSIDALGVEKALDAPSEVREDFFDTINAPVRQEAFAVWVDDILSTRKPTGAEETLGVINRETREFLSEKKEVDLQSPLITINDKGIIHALRDTKGSSLTIEEFKRLPEIIADPDEVYFDAGDEKEIPTLLYVVNLGDKDRGKVVIKLQRVVRNKVENWFATATRVKEFNLAGARYEKIERKK